MTSNKGMTLGQIVYTVINANPNGVDASALVAKVWERNPKALAGDIAEVARRLTHLGYVRQDDGQWYAPGPEMVIWKSL